MKISELLLENTDKKRHKTAAKQAPADNLDDNLDDLEDDNLDDSEDDLEDDEDEGNQQWIDRLIETGGRIDNDLVSITVYNVSDQQFSSALIPTAEAYYPLTNLKDMPIAQDYIKNAPATLSDVADNKIVSCLILNTRNNEIFRFDSGSNVNKFTPSIKELASSQTIDSDQVATLKEILARGKQYSTIVGKTQWRVGEDPRNNAERVYTALDKLIGGLNLQQSDRYRYDRVEISPEQEKKNKETKRRGDELFRLRRSERLKAEQEKQKEIAANPAGRKKR
jgi:hypothetical protein